MGQFFFLHSLEKNNIEVKKPLKNMFFCLLEKLILLIYLHFNSAIYLHPKKDSTLSWPQPNMSLIKELCDSLGKTSLTSLVGNYWASGGLEGELALIEGRTYKLYVVPARGECNIAYDSSGGLCLGSQVFGQVSIKTDFSQRPKCSAT